MNKQAKQEMVIRVASRKMARMEKQAHFLSGIQEKLTELLLKNTEKKVAEEAKGQSRASKAGLVWATSELGITSLEDVVMFLKKGSKLDLKDPIQRLIHERTKGAKDPVEVANLIGELSLAYKNQDVKGMAQALKVEEDVMALVLLWYTRSKTASDDYDWGDYRVDKIDKGTEKLLNISATTLKVLSYLTGGNAIEWIVKLLPKGSLLGKPLKWGWWTLLIVKRWAILGGLYNLAYAGVASLGAWMLSGAGGTFLAALAGTSILFVNPITIGIAISCFFYELVRMDKAERDWHLDNPFTSFKVPIKSVFVILKQLFTGALKVGKAILAELKEYLLENAGVLKNLFPDLSNWLSESRAFSPREQDQLALA